MTHRTLIFTIPACAALLFAGGAFAATIDSAKASPSAAAVMEGSQVVIQHTFLLKYDDPQVKCGAKFEFSPNSGEPPNPEFVFLNKPTPTPSLTIEKKYLKAGTYSVTMHGAAIGNVEACKGSKTSTIFIEGAAKGPAAPMIPIELPVGSVNAPTELTLTELATPLDIKTVKSQPDGSATVNYTLKGKGSGSCTVRIMTGEISIDTKISPRDGFPQVVPVKFSKPGKFSIEAYGIGCKGSTPKQWMEVTPHPEYPCSLYPGFKKSAEPGPTVACMPAATAPVLNVNSTNFPCPEGTQFKNSMGYVFGCFPPSSVMFK